MIIQQEITMIKKIITKTIITFAAAFCLFAEDAVTQLPVQIQADTYSDTEEEVKSEETDEYTEKEMVTIPKKKKTFFEDLFTFGNSGKFITTDSASVFVKGNFSGLKQVAAQITIFPETAETGIGSKYQGLYYITLLDQSSRAQLKKAMQSYFNDFENKKLIRKTKKTSKIYGKGKALIFWGTLRTSTPNNGRGDAFYGYEFIEGSPYFKITIPEVENQYYKVTQTVSRGSKQLQYYFTKAQLATLLDLITDDKINQSITDYVISEYGLPEDDDQY